jgi:hypothetical protein
VRAESGVEAEKLKSVKEQDSSQNPNPSHLEGFGTPASFNRAWVHSGAARKGWPPADGYSIHEKIPITIHGLCPIAHLDRHWLEAVMKTPRESGRIGSQPGSEWETGECYIGSQGGQFGSPSTKA